MPCFLCWLEFNRFHPLRSIDLFCCLLKVVEIEEGEVVGVIAEVVVVEVEVAGTIVTVSELLKKQLFIIISSLSLLQMDFSSINIILSSSLGFRVFSTNLFFLYI